MTKTPFSQILDDFNFIYENTCSKFDNLWNQIRDKIVPITHALGVYNNLSPFMNWSPEVVPFIGLLMLLPPKPGKKECRDNSNGMVDSFIQFKDEVSTFRYISYK